MAPDSASADPNTRVRAAIVSVDGICASLSIALIDAVDMPVLLASSAIPSCCDWRSSLSLPPSRVVLMPVRRSYASLDMMDSKEKSRRSPCG